MADDRERPSPGAGRADWGAAVALAMIAAFTLSHLAWPLLLRDTITAGGDTPAHHYLAAHLARTLFHEGRIVSWANGWWGGFPMFQFYFPLPYLAAAGIGQALPFHVAFKWVTVLGLLALPGCAYAAGRLMRLPRPTPLLLAIAALPFLFVRTHAMWGVNVSSTLAGMIANSWSFALLLPAVASAWRDAEDGRITARTPLLLALTAASHFFTACMAVLLVAVMPLLLARTRGFRAAARVLAAEGGLALLLLAWWWIPLLARREFSVDFGTDWPVRLADTFPPKAFWLAPLVAAGLWAAWRRGTRAVWLWAWMGAAGAALFAAGTAAAPVFVNIRLWPFVYFAWLALAACGIGLLAARARRPGLLVAAALLAAFAYVESVERHARLAVQPENAGNLAAPARPCAEWNFEGLEAKPFWPVFRELLEPLAGTPGRLAWDLNADHGVFGSVRVFEIAPYLFDKPTLEGGLVNSAAGSLAAYYVQGETSGDSAGFPALVRPATFDAARAATHLDLLNVKHFIARRPATQAAFATRPDWRLLHQAGDWQVFERLTHDGRYARAPRHLPVGVLTDRWQEALLEWLYVFEAVEQPFVFLKPGSRQARRFPGPILSETQFRLYLDTVRVGGDPVAAGLPPVFGLPAPAAETTGESVTDGAIRFRTTAPGAPHVVNVNYYPDWRARDGEVFMVTPGHLLVYPPGEEAALAFTRSGWDWLGIGLAWLGAAAWLALALRGARARCAAARIRLMKGLDATVGALACWVLARVAAPAPEPGAWARDRLPRRVLVIRPGGMGDMILLIPLLRRLRAAYPAAELDIVCESRNQAAPRLAGLDAAVWPADTRPFRTAARLLGRRYDLAIDTEQFHHLSALVAWLSRAPVRIGFKLNPARNPLYTHGVGYDLDGPEPDQFLRLLEPLGLGGPTRPGEGLFGREPGPVRPTVREAVERLAAGGRVVAIHPGGTSPGKRWGPARFGALAVRLLADGVTRLVLVGGPNDWADARAVARLAGGDDGRVLNLAGETTIEETAWALGVCGVFVGGDSGVAHLAAAAGARTVVLFGSGDPRKWAAAGPGHTVVRGTALCAPCSVFGYERPCGHWQCQSTITVEAVVETALLVICQSPQEIHHA